MSTPSLQKELIYHDVTQYIKRIEPSIQLQKIRCMRHRESGNWLFDFDFYPSPRRTLWVSDGKHGSWGWLEGVRSLDKDFSMAQNPLSLYLKSHFIGRRLGEISSADSGYITWDFGEGYLWKIGIKSSNVLEFAIQVPGRKLFVKELKLYPAGFFEYSNEVIPQGSAVLVVASKQNSRNEKLLQNIRADLQSAKGWIAKFSSLCLELGGRPWLWHQPGDTDEDQVWDQKIQELQLSGLLPKNRDASFLKAALDKLFNERSRQERKVKKAAMRLHDIETKVASGDDSLVKPSPMARRMAEQVQEKAYPGMKVEVVPGLYGYLGRSARENELLFKWVRDRDFWFHVRGYSGGHLWLLRSDLGLGKDSFLLPTIAERAAKIALWNSKLKNSGSGSVDFTERRHLKKLKGEVGALKINQSQVLFVTLEEGFEKTLKWS